LGVVVSAPSVFFPGAEWRPIPYRGKAVGMLEYRGWVLHVVVGDGSPYQYFCDLPKGKRAFSHLWVAKDGRVEQYQKLDRASWAQAEGNPYWWSLETAGDPDEPLTDEQIKTLARWHVWCGAKDQLASSPNGRGIGTHSMGGLDWGAHDCPGKIRAAQRKDIIAEAKRLRAAGNDGTGLESDVKLDDVVYTEKNGVPVTVLMCLRSMYRVGLGLSNNETIEDVNVIRKAVTSDVRK
jgi:hypothetical protein